MDKLTWTTQQADYWWSNTVDHGIRDEKGRAVGGYAGIHFLRPPPPDSMWQYGAGREGKYELEVYAARDGKKYGAIPRGTVYDTLEEAQAAAAAKLAKQRAAYAKKYGAAK
jgi:hypothetical protein